jgi:hypothetical protein
VPGAKSSWTLTRPRTVSLRANALALVEGNSNAVAGDRHQIFFGYSGEAHSAPLAAHQGCARNRRAPEADQNTCRRVALIADRRDLDRNTSRDQTEITRRNFQLPTGPCARRLGGGTSSARQRSAAGDAGGCRRAAGMRVVGPRRVGRSRPRNVVAHRPSWRAMRAVRASDVADWHTAFRC